MSQEVPPKLILGFRGYAPILNDLVTIVKEFSEVFSRSFFVTLCNQARLSSLFHEILVTPKKC